MGDFSQLNMVFEKAVTQAGEESSLLLGQTFSAGAVDQVGTNRLTYFSDMEDAILIAAVESKEDYSGRFYLIFSLRDAILLSGMLLGIPPARISEKRKLAIIENDDYDAFGEIMNQVIGSFNTVFKPSFANKVHLKLVKPKKFVPDVDGLAEDEPIPEGDYLLFRSQLGLDGYEMDRLDILMPRHLALAFEPQEEAPSPATAVVEEAAELPEAAAEEVAAPPAAAAEEGVSEAGEEREEREEREETIIILEDDLRERENLKRCLEATGVKLLDAPLSADIRELFAQGDVRVAVVGVADTEDRELALCIKIAALRHDKPMPIIMCAPGWTRSGVLKAVKYGARDIILKPYTQDELVTKVKRFLRAA